MTERTGNQNYDQRLNFDEIRSLFEVKRKSTNTVKPPEDNSFKSSELLLGPIIAGPAISEENPPPQTKNLSLNLAETMSDEQMFKVWKALCQYQHGNFFSRSGSNDLPQPNVFMALFNSFKTHYRIKQKITPNEPGIIIDDYPSILQKLTLSEVQNFFADQNLSCYQRSAIIRPAQGNGEESHQAQKPWTKVEFKRQLAEYTYELIESCRRLEKQMLVSKFTSDLLENPERFLSEQEKQAIDCKIASKAAAKFTETQSRSQRDSDGSSSQGQISNKIAKLFLKIQNIYQIKLDLLSNQENSQIETEKSSVCSKQESLETFIRDLNKFNNSLDSLTQKHSEALKSFTDDVSSKKNFSHQITQFRFLKIAVDRALEELLQLTKVKLQEEYGIDKEKGKDAKKFTSPREREGEGVVGEEIADIVEKHREKTHEFNLKALNQIELKKADEAISQIQNNIDLIFHVQTLIPTIQNKIETESRTPGTLQLGIEHSREFSYEMLMNEIQKRRKEWLSNKKEFLGKNREQKTSFFGRIKNWFDEQKFKRREEYFSRIVKRAKLKKYKPDIDDLERELRSPQNKVLQLSPQEIVSDLRFLLEDEASRIRNEPESRIEVIKNLQVKINSLKIEHHNNSLKSLHNKMQSLLDEFRDPSRTHPTLAELEMVERETIGKPSYLQFFIDQLGRTFSQIATTARQSKNHNEPDLVKKSNATRNQSQLQPSSVLASGKDRVGSGPSKSPSRCGIDNLSKKYHTTRIL